MNRGKVLDWILKTTPTVPTESQVQEMSAQNFDEELFMRQTLEEMKKMKAEGKPVDIQDIVKELTLSIEGRKVIRRRPAAPKTPPPTTNPLFGDGLARKCGVKPIRFHDLRHSFASNQK